MRRAAGAALLLLLPLAGCSGGDTSGDGSTNDAAASSSPSTTPSASATPTTATAAPKPRDRACYRLDYDAAVAPTSTAKPQDCGGAHTAMTYAVGTLDTVVAGHLVAVDSAKVQQQVATECPQRLPAFLGGSPEALRLSMLRAVWFTPTVEESDAGADWYRCDVIAVAAEGRLAPLTGALRGVLARPDAAARYGMCGTAEPGTSGFDRVICSGSHSWRAIDTVTFGGSAYPGVAKARDAGQGPCEDAARARASDALNFKWSYEWPTAAQWRGGQTYGLCWIPD